MEVIKRLGFSASLAGALCIDLISGVEGNSGDAPTTKQPESYLNYIDDSFPRWIAVLLFVVGIFGNSLSLAVFTRKNMRGHSTFLYLAFLSVIDIFVLCLGLGDLILLLYFKFIIRNTSWFSCRCHTFLTYTFTHLSSFIIASVSVDRAIATNMIVFAKKYCTPRFALRVVLANCSLAAIINAHDLFFLGHEKEIVSATNATANDSFAILGVTELEFNCASLTGTLYDRFLSPYFEWIDLFFYALLPFACMIVCTGLILKVIFTSNGRINRQRSASAAALGRTSAPSKADRERHARANQLTYTLVTINVCFFALVSPLVIVLILAKSEALGEAIQGNTILLNIVYLLAYANHSFNFIFYGLSSPPYRDAVLKLLHLKKTESRFKTSYAAVVAQNAASDQVQ